MFCVANYNFRLQLAVFFGKSAKIFRQKVFANRLACADAQHTFKFFLTAADSRLCIFNFRANIPGALQKNFSGRS